MGEPGQERNLLPFHDDLPKNPELDKLRRQRVGAMEQRDRVREGLPAGLHEEALGLPKGDDSAGLPPRKAPDLAEQLHLREPGAVQHLGQPLLLQANLHQRDFAQRAGAVRRERGVGPIEGAAGVRGTGDRPGKLSGALDGRQPKRGRASNVLSAF